MKSYMMKFRQRVLPTTSPLFFLMFATSALAAPPTVGILQPLSEYQMIDNLVDKNSQSTLIPVGTGNDGTNRCNKTSSFGTDTGGSFWSWSAAGCARGGGFHIDVDQDIRDSYTIGVRFRFADIDSHYRKVIDYLDRSADTGFYIQNKIIRFYLNSSNVPAGHTVIQPNEILDLVVTRSGSDKKFTVYTVTNNGLAQELTFVDSTDQARPKLVDSKTRLGFFFDDVSTGGEATASGAVYSIKVWNQPIEAADVLGSVSFSDHLSFNEDIVQATPQSLNLGVPVRDADSANFNNGYLHIVPNTSLHEDTLSINSTGDGAKQIRVDTASGQVFYEGTLIGNFPLSGAGSGQQGLDLKVTLNANVTVSGNTRVPAAEALLRALQYQNDSNTPTRDRTSAVIVNDGAASSNPIDIQIQVVAVNDVPHANDDVFSIAERETLTVHAGELLKNDSDPESQPLSAAGFTAPSKGTLNQPVPTDGGFVYIAPDISTSPETVTFTYMASDGVNNSPPATVSIRINPVNRAPVGTPDHYVVSEDTQLSVDGAHGLLANDHDPDAGDHLKVDSFTQPTHGTLSAGALDGHFVYMPGPGYSGPDSFTYHVGDGHLTAGPVTVDITVNPVNDPPLASPDSFIVPEHQVLHIPAPGLLGNDSDPDGDQLKVVPVSSPACGTFNPLTGGGFTFQTEVGTRCQPGDVTFTYHASDGALKSADVPVVVTISDVNDPPTANPDSYTLAEDNVLKVAAPGLLKNDTDPDGNTLAVVPVSKPSHGTLSFTGPDGGFEYHPDHDYSGMDEFTYKANDAHLDSTAVSVNLTVSAVNDPPVAQQDAYWIHEDTVLNVPTSNGLLKNDSDPEGNPLKVILDTVPTHGNLQINLDGAFTYHPDANYNGTDTFTYHANDGSADSAWATVQLTVSGVNDAPLAGNDTYSVAEDTLLSVDKANGVLANDLDLDGNQLMVILDSSPGHGNLQMSLDGSFTYQPQSDFTGADSFTYHASDGSANSTVVTVHLYVTSVNDLPLAGDDVYSTPEDTLLSVSAANGVLANDLDLDGNQLLVILDSSPSHGSLQITLDGAFDYRPQAGFNGTDSFTYHANDGAADSAIVTVHLTVSDVNDTPLAGNDAYSTPEDTPFTIGAVNGLLANDLDLDGNQLKTVLMSPASNGSLSLALDGSFVYAPNPNFNGIDVFTYKASDGSAHSNEATVTITINGINDTPSALADTYTLPANTRLDVTAASGVLNNDRDSDGDLLSAIIQAYPVNGVLHMNTDGGFSYTALTGFSGSDSFTYVASDGSATSVPATVNLTVSAVNTAPVGGSDSYSTNRDSVLQISKDQGVLANDFDLDGNLLTAVWGSSPAHGMLSLQMDGSFTYTPAPGYSGLDSFTYHPSDGQLDGAAVQAVIDVHFSNSPPVSVDDNYSIAAGTQLQISNSRGVLVNDSDPDGNTMTIVVLSPPANGVLHALPDGSFKYHPAAGFAGTDNFTYAASDGVAQGNTATVTIQVTQTNQPPVAVDDQFTVTGGAMLNISAPGILVNDSDPEGHALHVAQSTSPVNGLLHLVGTDGGFIYTPNPGFTGPDSFTYQVSDGALDSGVATVSIMVEAAPLVPARPIPSLSRSMLALASILFLMLGMAAVRFRIRR